MFPIQVPEKVGASRELARKFGRALVVQDFSNPRTGGVDTFSIWHAKACPVLALPVTKDGDVIVLDQFRHQAAFGVADPMDAIAREVPGGNPKDDQTPEDLIRSEIREETGYAVTGELIRLTPKLIWIDPASLSFPYWPMLALGCVPEGEPKPGPTEFFEVLRLSLAEWIRMIHSGKVNDSRAIAITFLALPYLVARGFRVS